MFSVKLEEGLGLCSRDERRHDWNQGKVTVDAEPTPDSASLHQGYKGVYIV
ncbi:hypothetical protein [Alkalimarinus alittae]|uniref:Uncharacterized protein n=1 Tax=Alkalimarinus alittae TaxID=2961619 RepID=A0ABY6N605_9ALTE|nr:hypothetical protein [Alkalimarinus alittae]UZE97548.1 hypothetical protein NKI27_07345 [Alkalimarinus alittae]